MAELPLDTAPESLPIDYRRLGKGMVGLVFLLIIGTIPGILVISVLVGFALIPTFSAIVGGAAFGILGIMAAAISAAAVGFATVGATAVILFPFIPLGATIAGILHARSAADYAGLLFRLSRPTEEDDLGNRVIKLSQKLGLKEAPGAMWIDGNVVNAFAMGGSTPGKGIVAIGAPLRSGLTSDELDAIIGHELGHIAYNDVKRTMFFRSFQNWLAFAFVFYRIKVFARWLFTFFNEVGLLAHSRKREFHADAIGAALTSKEAMIGALRKIDDPKYILSKHERRYATVMFRGVTGSWFSTHPTIARRVAALESEWYLKHVPRKQLPPPTVIAVPHVKYDGI